MPPKTKRTLRERLTPGKMSGWLPAVALFLCLSMFAIAALILFQVGADPKSPPSAVPTSVAAQGFAGTRRLLDAEGYYTVINRYEDTGQTERGDLEIITLDETAGLFLSKYDALDAQESSASASAEGAEASVTVEGDVRQLARFLEGQVGEVPDPVRANHILYQPLGKAVLIVAPKWDAGTYRRNPRWAQGPVLRHPKGVAQVLQVLAPVTETETEYGADDMIVRPVEVPGREVHVEEYVTYSYNVVTYDIRRVSRPAPAKAQMANPKNDPVVTARNAPDPDLPVEADVVLTPAVGQPLFAAPVRAGKISGLQTISGPNLQPVLTTADGRPVLSRVIVPGGAATKVPVYLLSDPDLLNNQILAQPEKVVTALDLINRVAPGEKTTAKIVFNMTFNGLSFDRDLLHALSRPPFLGVPLALLTLGLALMWAAFARFGPAQEAPAGPPLGRGVRTLADNAARLMAITFKETRLGPAYATLVRDQVIRGRGFMQVDPAQSLDDLAERIGTTHGATDSYLNLKDKAARVATVHQLIDVTLKLHAWKTEIERAHK
ncbi:hypothetical protein ABI_19860 [Asticcacaulis biprosthecium C19]|uniref:DUF4350 domain-containing protein n=1 Tax=Asticcacaulis biprosthecium C19 TaxID=715226 RepID=F4QLP8_9CAUL|nr:hypothetical protein [Asticcacaulis biprosthecium]EGF93546.1 hypothetical protein ABI_19860 [Asticcacaulis biprosthecium C19]